MATLLVFLKYLGISVTGSMAVFSLFFEFTRTIEGTEGKRLTKHGRIALGITCLSIIITLLATISKDVLDNQVKKKEKIEKDRLFREVKLGSEVFETLEIRLVFDEQFDWLEDKFLAERLSEVLTGSWSRTGSWRFTKKKSPVSNGWERRILFTEGRPENIRKFFEQNQPLPNSQLPPFIPLKGGEESIGEYKPQVVIYFDYLYYQKISPISSISFKVPILSGYYYPPRDSGLTLSFLLQESFPYSDLIGSRISLSYRFDAPDFITTGPSMFDRKPSERPFLADHLQSIGIFLNGQYISDIHNDQIPGLRNLRPNSVGDVHNNSYYVTLADYEFVRGDIVEHYDPDIIVTRDGR